MTVESVHLAAEVAALQPALEAREHIALVVLTLVSLAALQEGSTRFPVVGPESKAPLGRILTALLGNDFGSDGPQAMAKAIESLLRSNNASTVVGRRADEYKPLLFLSPYIFHHRIHYIEGELANRIAAMLVASAKQVERPKNVETLLEEVFARPVFAGGAPIYLSPEQRSAVAAAAATGLTVISGGPGTGKTSIVVAILRLMVRLGVDPALISLAAPTGKAAHRMGECVRASLTQTDRRDAVDQTLLDNYPEPTTMHRLLGYSPEGDRFRHHRNNPLSARVVIVDEGSMLDLTLMERLVNAMRDDARLILLGDANQLPSVAAGSVFRDFVPRAGVDAGPFAAVSIELKENHRMQQGDADGRAVLALAQSINEGNARLPASDETGDGIIAQRNSAAELKFAGVELVAASASKLGPFLDRWYEERVRGGSEIAELVAHEYVERDGAFDAADGARLQRLFAHFGRSRILCVTRVFETGADRINERLHMRAAEFAGVAAGRVEHVVGEPLMVLRNDYERGLFNGDQGLLLWVRRAGDRQMPMAVFPRAENFVAFRFDTMREFVELSYAMTVHKAQGSEYDSVAIVLPEAPIAMLTRELLYTAVSRARASVAILGDDTLLSHAVANRVERFSGLAERVKSRLAPSS
ncbi:MAG TPA: exodeoxyribonuclease V subunit alpha [Candidatus Acidoferrales bacterium]|nr:exodeoxyribonuclease V subunit alpha [Candidatus Acidoferrales bacterium]